MLSEEVGRCDPLLRFQNRKILPGRLGVHGVIRLEIYGFFVKLVVGREAFFDPLSVSSGD